jgi:hypothetical protein
MHGFGIRLVREPGLFHGEGQHRREPGHQAVEDLPDHLQRRLAAQARGRIAVERILADIEIERRQFDIGKIGQRREMRLKSKLS